MMNYKGVGLCYLPQPSASADDTNLCLNNSSYLSRPHSIIVYQITTSRQKNQAQIAHQRCIVTERKKDFVLHF